MGKNYIATLSGKATFNGEEVDTNFIVIANGVPDPIAPTAAVPLLKMWAQGCSYCNPGSAFPNTDILIDELNVISNTAKDNGNISHAKIKYVLKKNRNTETQAPANEAETIILNYNYSGGAVSVNAIAQALLQQITAVTALALDPAEALPNMYIESAIINCY